MAKTESTYTAFKQRVRRWAKKEFPFYGTKSETLNTDFTKAIIFFPFYIEDKFPNCEGYSYSIKENTFKVDL